MNTTEPNPLEIKMLSKDKFNDWLDQLHEYQIFAPVQRENYSEFSKIREISEIELAIRNTIRSPKKLILSQTANMLEYNLSRTTPETDFNSHKQDKTIKNLILGIRPCDSRGFASIDLTFDAEFKDPYYLTLRNNSVLIGLACLKPDLNCFCSSVNSGPFDGSAMDIMMIDCDSSYLFNVYTEKGQKLIEPHIELFTEPGTDESTKANNLKADAEAIVTRRMETSGKAEKLGEMFESEYWDTISKKCLGCGICTYLCPTCYCFDITDEKWGYKGTRVRTWDSCMYPEYTVHASGYNPRPARLNRLRNRVYHKFKYYPDLYNEIGCTGCGRCIRHCPVNIDIIDIINGV